MEETDGNAAGTSQSHKSNAGSAVWALKSTPGILCPEDCRGFADRLARPPVGDDCSRYRASHEDLMHPLPAFLDVTDGKPVFYPHGTPQAKKGGGSQDHSSERTLISKLVVPTSAVRILGADTGKPSLRTMFQIYERKM